MTGVLIVAERVLPERGGLAVATDRIIRHAAANGEEVHVLHPSLEVDPGVRGFRSLGGLTYHPVGRSRRDDDTAMALFAHGRDLLSRYNSTLVHGIYAVSAGYLAVSLAAEKGLPSVVSVRGNDLDRGRFRADHFPFVRFALERATVVTAVSRALAEAVERLFRRPARHVTNAVDVEAFAPVPRDEALAVELELSEGATLAFLGELRDKKGLRFLLPAFDRVRQRRAANLLLIGGVRKDAQAAFDRFAEIAPDARARIRLVDYVRDAKKLSRLLALADLMVFPSLYDGTPNAVLESMAAGRPVLATDAGGQADLIRHGENGALLPLSELDRLPEAVEELLDLEVERREAFGAAARAHVERFHAPLQERKAYAQVYREAREKAPLPGRRLWSQI